MMKNLLQNLSRFTQVWVIILVFASCQSPVPPVKKTVEPMKISFPTSTDFSVDYLKSKFWRISYNSAGEDLAYKIILPTVIRPTEVKPTPVETIGITLIGEYQVVEKSEPYMEVQVAYEKIGNNKPDVKSWFDEKLRKLKGTLVQSSAIKIGDKDGYDVLFTRTLVSGEQYVSRASMLVAGENYVMVTAMASKADYEKSAKTIYHILSNWNMQ
jgi:hypothetical protein